MGDYFFVKQHIQYLFIQKKMEEIDEINNCKNDIIRPDHLSTALYLSSDLIFRDQNDDKRSRIDLYIFFY